MRCLGLILFIQFFVSSCFGQQVTRSTYSYFEIENREAVWVYIFPENNKTEEEIRENMIDHLKHKTWVKKLEKDNGDLMVDIENYLVEYKKHGGSYTRTPMVIRSGRWSAKVRISFKDDKYRVMVFGLNYFARQTTVHHGRIKPVDTELSGTWSDFVLTESRTQFRKSKFKALHLMNASLKDNFTLPDEPSKKDEEW
jgi:hypothetical protein